MKRRNRRKVSTGTVSVTDFSLQELDSFAVAWHRPGALEPNAYDLDLRDFGRWTSWGEFLADWERVRPEFVKLYQARHDEIGRPIFADLVASVVKQRGTLDEDLERALDLYPIDHVAEAVEEDPERVCDHIEAWYAEAETTT
jgi:hypothetical protein